MKYQELELDNRTAQ